MQTESDAEFYRKFVNAVAHTGEKEIHKDPAFEAMKRKGIKPVSEEVRQYAWTTIKGVIPEVKPASRWDRIRYKISAAVDKFPYRIVHKGAREIDA